jgi:predicted DNA-binding transcriptional regulator YafY
VTGVQTCALPIYELGGEAGYRIHPEDYYLPDLGLGDDERAALHVAVTAVRLEGGAAQAGLRKLGGIEGAAAPPVAQLEVTPSLADCFDAVAKRRMLEFEYRGEARALEPYGVVHRFGRWYVVGRDRARDAGRSFRVDRIEGVPKAGPVRAFEPPPDVDPAAFLRADPLSYGDEAPIDAFVLVDATRAAWVVDDLGADAVVERRDNGAVVVRLRVVNQDAFRTWVLGLLEYAEVLAPTELRADIMVWLQALSGGRT